MKYQWRKKAENQVKQTICYCTEMFGKKQAEKFLSNIDHQVNLLAINPLLGPIEPLLEKRARTYRSLLVHKHFKLIYYVNTSRDTLYLVAMWDTRREPDRLAASIR